MKHPFGKLVEINAFYDVGVRTPYSFSSFSYPHEHDWFYCDQIQFIYVEYGSLSVTVDSYTYNGHPGDLIYIPPWISRKFDPPSADFCFHLVEFHPTILEKLSQFPQIKTDLAYWINSNWKTQSGYTALNREERKILEDLFLKYDSHQGFTMDVLRLSTFLEIMCQICIHLKRSSALRQGKKTEGSLSARAIDYIEERLSDQSQIKVREIANHLFVTENHLRTVFKKETSLTVKEYINHRRITEAKRVLQDSRKRPHDAFLASGFCDYSNFLRMFQNLEHMNPSEYQRQFQQQRASQSVARLKKFSDLLPEEEYRKK